MKGRIMDKTVKKKWLEALRSGEYTQAKSAFVMHDKTGGFCPAGVLMDLYIKAKNLSWTPPTSEDEPHHIFIADKVVSRAWPPKSVMKWAGLTGTEFFSVAGREYSLYGLNDILALSFLEIADIIEAQL